MSFEPRPPSLPLEHREKAAVFSSFMFSQNLQRRAPKQQVNMKNTKPDNLDCPQTSPRRPKRLTPLAFHHLYRQQRIGTLKFEELDFDIEKPKLVPSSDTSLSRESSFNSLRSQKSSGKSAHFGFWWTIAIVGLPIPFFTATILAFVFVFRVPNDTTHPLSAIKTTSVDSQSILVDFSATRLTFIASWSSTLAPMLLGSLMALWHIPTACRLASATAQNDIHELPTPHQLSMLIGLSNGSFEELRKYFVYRLSKVKAHQSSLLTRSAVVLVIASLFAFFIFCADTAIHTFTSTVPYSKVKLQTPSSNAFGRGLISQCIDFDRKANQGFPCTVIADATVGANIMARNSGEVISLQQNVSSDNSIWTVQDQRLKHGDLLVLMPQVADTPANVDYHATTVGVSTQCVPSSSRCDVRMSGNPTDESSYVVFNCTENFRGVLGADPSISNDTLLWTHTDATTPDFNFKYDRNFQYAYFSDAQLNTIYNSIGGNATNGGASGELALPDDQLINPIFLAVAGLVPVSNGPAGESLSKDRNLLSIGGAFVAYTLNCSVTSYDVAYDWINGSINSFNFSQTRNGSILELAHGMQATGMPALSQAQSLASLSASAEALGHSFANQHSENSLTLIASVMSPRMDSAEAIREDLLVAKISVAPFGFLVGSNLLYTIFGVVLIIRAWRLNSPDTRDMVARMSLEGLSAMAFEDTIEKRVRRVEDVHDMFEESRIGASSRQVGLKAYQGGGHVMFVEQPRL
ncbi:uncharacterized protein Z520_01108 [Fonsecaea multimorphosa CBS 102226]|uniref:Uncharacterized protein n=1 Tax=Fonsecaea multimorphosa CBS 102226 TaxID=1442371 RepID=A0A0D2K992_9EURO|nr:uncharacterized protein Z520_01108 [Fonsecaea multimorphosa CBS 102226]KIY02643.1 hypothetical protein Z520_01108 [Fonsecaea multimorphosa CBS 102226]OAL31506.1 hypothetical protein AYO22_01098 [Fonsecaea multimorphosa]